MSSMEISKEFLDIGYKITDEFLDNAIKNIEEDKRIINDLVKDYRIYVYDDGLYRRLVFTLKHHGSRHAIGLCLVFIKYIFDDHVSLNCYRRMDDTIKESKPIFYNNCQKIMPKMEHIGSIVYSLLIRQKIDDEHLHKYVRRLPSADYGKPLSDIIIVCT